MSLENRRDPRAVLVREKYFTLRPKPLERWIWQQGLPQAAERVFWLHWEEGMRRGDWVSELPLKRVARECCIDISTVTRAYQLLKGLELIRREDPGRDPANPFQQGTALTEVRVPRDLLVSLHRSPTRWNRERVEREAAGARPDDTAPTLAAPVSRPSGAGEARTFTREESQSLMRKLSDFERAAFFTASRDRRTSMSFDEDTALSAAERGRVLALLARVSGERPEPLDASRAPPASQPTEFAQRRRLSPLEAARVRKRILDLIPLAQGPEIFRQVLWSMEEGALRRFDARLAANIAFKKIREGAWTRPNRMPPNWRCAAPETCSAA
jgi:hypothetical protein